MQVGGMMLQFCWVRTMFNVDVHEQKNRRRISYLVNGAMEGARCSKRSSKILREWSTTHHHSAFVHNDPPTLMKTFLHLYLSTPRSLPLPLNHEILEPIWNLPLHLNNSEETSRRLHNECSDMMMMGINDKCPPLQELEVDVVHDIMQLVCMTWPWHANVPCVMTQLITCSAVHIMCHCYIICHMLRPIVFRMLGTGGES